MKKQFILTIILCVYAVLVFFGSYHHEPWRDEAHAWIVARDSTLPTIVNDIQYEGVPALWYLILFPFAKLGMPYETMSILHAGFAVLAAGLLLFFGTLPLIVKILFIFSYYVAFEYAVVARNYVLTVFLLIAIACSYPKRFVKPLRYAILVSLLFHANLHSVGLAGALTGMYVLQLVYERKLTFRRIVAFLLMVASAVITTVTLLRGPMMRTIVPVSGYTIETYYNVIRNAVVPSFAQYQPLVFQFFPADFFISFGTYIVMGSLLIMTLKNWPVFIVAVLQIGWLFYVDIIVHPAQLRHRGLLLVTFLFILWIANKNRSYTPLLRLAKAMCIMTLSCLLLVSWFYTVYIYRQDYAYNFSGASDMARYIRTQGLETRTIITFYSAHAVAVLPYLTKKTFWYPEFGASGYFNTASVLYHKVLYSNTVTIDDAIARAKETASDSSPGLLLLSMTLPSSEEKNFTLLHTSQAPFFWEDTTDNFWLYSFNPHPSNN